MAMKIMYWSRTAFAKNCELLVPVPVFGFYIHWLVKISLLEHALNSIESNLG